jgi:asparagine synthase (glutamine-hydrolysing)
MCGIAGEINLRFENLINKDYLKTLCHRGPHSQSYFKASEKLNLYHTRLKIIDLSNQSNQPMLSSDNRYVISYNGELYNYLELKKKLQDFGFIFKTQGDTEVFLNGFIKYGKSFFSLANGIFAVAIYDKITHDLYLARDFIGVKPLYYTLKEDKFIFASEIKAILQSNSVDRKIDKSLINEFLFYKYISGNKTLFKNILRIEPGNIYKINLNNKKIKINKFPYYEFKEEEKKQSLPQTIVETESLINKSVAIQLQSDANIGIQLSGGVDSAIITEIANKIKDINYLYCSTFNGYSNNEFKYANIVSKKNNIQLNKIELDKSFFFKNWNKSIYHLDEPLNHPHSLAIMQIAKKATKKVSVMLAGEGADELFFGYERYMNIFQNNNSEFLVRNGAFLRTKDDLEFFNLLKNSKFGEPHKNRLEIFNKINIENKIKKFQLFETKTHLQSLLLRSDKMMMAHSVEARVPYLDKDLFNYSINISDKIKKANIQKIVLKKILSKYGYSSSFVNRKKIGYLIPFNQWINSQKKIVNELNDEILLQLFNRKYLEIIKNNISTNKNIYSSSKFFWLFLNLKKFIRIFEIDAS